jgi:hypothetical protein
MINSAKGSVLRATLDFVDREAGGVALGAVLNRLPPGARDAVCGAAATEEVPLALIYELWRAVDEVLVDSDPHWIERSGAHSIESLGVQLYGGIVRKPTPADFLTQRISLFRLFYHSGEMEVVEREAERAVLRLVGFDEGDRLFCRRQTGGLRRALELAGGDQASARHVRCVHEHDAFCEWELAWRDASAIRRATPTSPAP